jgi:dual specificity phosphatase 3
VSMQLVNQLKTKLLSYDTIPRMDFSPITDNLFIGTTPSADDYEHLRELGVKLIINMRVEYRPRKDPFTPPLRFLWLPTFDSPLIPIPIRYLIQGAITALETIQNGGKVYAHCAGGVHRGVTMGAAILIAQGYDPHAAMTLIKQRRPIADPFVFYIRSRIMKFARRWALKVS